MRPYANVFIQSEDTVGIRERDRFFFSGNVLRFDCVHSCLLYRLHFHAQLPNSELHSISSWKCFRVRQSYLWVFPDSRVAVKTPNIENHGYS